MFRVKPSVSMNTKIGSAMEELLANRPDLFGSETEFIAFRRHEERPSAAGLYSATYFGRMEFWKDRLIQSSPSLAVKCVLEECKFYEISKMMSASNEILFYTKISPLFENLGMNRIYPQFYNHLSWSDSSSFQSVTIMEDLTETGYQPTTNCPYQDFDHIAIMLQKLAEFHACSYRAMKTEPLRFRSIVKKLGNHQFSHVFAYLDIADELLGSAARQLQRDPEYASKIGDLDEFVEEIKTSLIECLENEWNDPTLVLCHGDFGYHNFLFKYEDGKPVDGKMFDFGYCTLSTPSLDLLWFTLACSTPEIRKTRWDDLVDLYYTTLYSSFEEVPSKEAILKGFAKKLPLSLFNGLLFMPFLDVIAREKLEFEVMDHSPQKLMEIGNTADPGIQLFVLKDFLDRREAFRNS